MLLLKKMKTVGGAFDRQSFPSQLPSSPDLTVIQRLGAAALELTVSGDSQSQPARTRVYHLPLSTGRLRRDFSAVDAFDRQPSTCLRLALGCHRPRPKALPRQHRQGPGRIRRPVAASDCVLEDHIRVDTRARPAGGIRLAPAPPLPAGNSRTQRVEG